MSKVLALVIVAVLSLSSVAMAGDLGSADSSFLFGQEQVAATTMTDVEMQATQGQISLNALLANVLGLLNNLGLGGLLGPVLGVATGLLPGLNLDGVLASVLGIVNQIIDISAVNGVLGLNILGLIGVGISV